MAGWQMEMLPKHPPLLLLHPINTTARIAMITPPIRHFSTAAASAPGGGGLALYLRRAKLIDCLRLRLLSHDPSSPFPLPPSPLFDSFVASRAIRAAPSPESALSLLRSLLSHPSFTLNPQHPSILHSVSRRLPDHLSLLPDIRLSPLHRLRLLAASGDLQSALETFSSLRSSPGSLRCNHRTHPCTESYNLIIGLHAAAGDHSSAVSTFFQMISDGAIPNSRTYTVIIDHLVQANNADAAMEIFHLLPSIRIRRTSKQYNVLANAFSSSDEQRQHLLMLIKEMNSDGILPGRPMLAAIAKLRASGFIEITDEFVRELSPDQRIGYAVDSLEEDDEEEEEGNNERIKLKPWIDPAALARALEDWNPADVDLLEAAGFVWSSRLVCKLLRSFRTPETAWRFFCWVAYQPGGFAHDRHTVSRMIAILANAGHVELVDRLISKLQSEGILLPFDTVRLIVDFYGLSKNSDAAIKIYRSAGTICGPLSRLNLVLLSSCLLRTVIKSRQGEDAMALQEEMMAGGILLDVQTFSGLMEYFAGEGDLKSVHRLFGAARQCGLKPDSFMYELLMRAYCKQERAVLAMRLFDEMLISGLPPSRGTKRILVKSLWKEGKLREAAVVEEKSEEVGDLPAKQPGHVWTASAADFDRVLKVYSGSFAQRGTECRCAEGV
ncbi:Pentatricopeptide repeat-containing protein [Platanthera zijinensis]|uniref:Pentatricopeptide repeat-containing protein n=1 Tax=Platanthera zijinensis TaxID=2320716 RepID=A0AAP0BSG0_9ASPA